MTPRVIAHSVNREIKERVNREFSDLLVKLVDESVSI